MQLNQGSYVILLILMTVVMAAGLTAFAVAFDTYVIKQSEVPFSNLNLREATSDLADGGVLESLVTEIKRLI